MKNITLILLISLSGLSHGTDKLNVFPSLSVSPIVVQQALASADTHSAGTSNATDNLNETSAGTSKALSKYWQVLAMH